MATVIFQFIGGIAIFFFGMREMASGMEKVASDRLRDILHLFTRNRVIAVLAGAGLTAVLQSSSASTILVVGFVNASLLSLRQAVGVIMGANIGTTVTGWLVALFAALAHLKITQYTLPAVAAGFFLYAYGRRHHVRDWGQFIFGFGMLFLGLNFMKDGVDPLKSSEWLRTFFIQCADHPLLGLVAGLGMTMVLQSSSATIAILQVLAINGLVPFTAALPILVGDNIGTTVTAQLAGWSIKSVTARRAAMAHTLFNVLGAVWALPLIYLGIFSGVVEAILGEPEAARLAVFIAVAHSLFNVANTCLFLPFVKQLEQLAVRFTPGQPPAAFTGPKYLDRNLLVTPSLALDAVVREVDHMLELAREGLRLAIDGLRSNRDRLDRVELLEDNVDSLQIEIFRYLSAVSEQEMNEAEARRLPRIFHVVNDIEKVSDYAERIMRLHPRLEPVFLEDVMRHFDGIAGRTLDVMDTLALALDDDGEAGEDAARRALELCREVKDCAVRLKDEHVQRLTNGTPHIPCEQVLDDAIDYLVSARGHMINVAEARLSGKLV